MLNLRDCTSLCLIPCSVSGLKSLKVLLLSCYSKLEKLPDDLGKVKSLEELDVAGTAIRERSWLGTQQDIIVTFAFLQSLRTLNLINCNLWDMGIIPVLSHIQFSLKRLNLSFNQFRRLPENISQLYVLEYLDLQSCQYLEELPNLPPHAEVNANNCISLEMVQLHNYIKYWNFLSKAYFLNCFRLEKQGCNSLAFTLHLQALSYRRQVEKFEFVIPGNDIPGWFNHQSADSSVTIDLPPGSFNTKLMGFAFCAVFAVQQHAPVSLSDEYSPTHEIHCQYEVNGKERFHLPGFAFNGHLGQAVTDHLWIFCSSLHGCEDWQHIEFLFTTDGLGLQVKKSGVRIVYCEDEEEIKVNNVSQEPFTFSDVLCPVEAETIPGATTKRGREVFDFGSDDEADVGCGLLGALKEKLI